MNMRFASTFMCKQKLPLLHIPNGNGIDLKIMRRQQREKVVVVMGPTDAGKLRLSVGLTTQFSAEIVNADKIQVYRGFDVLTNKVIDEEAGGVPHHLLGIIDPDKDFTAKNFRNPASRCIKSIAGRGRLPIIAGDAIPEMVQGRNHLYIIVQPALQFRKWCKEEVICTSSSRRNTDRGVTISASKEWKKKQGMEENHMK